MASRSCLISARSCSALRRATCWIKASSATCDALMPSFLPWAYTSELMVRLTVRLAALVSYEGALTRGAYPSRDTGQGPVSLTGAADGPIRAVVVDRGSHGISL